MTARTFFLSDRPANPPDLSRRSDCCAARPDRLARLSIACTIRGMDPLSDVLRAVRLNGAFFYVFEGTAPWSISVAPARQLVPRVLPAADHLMAYHIVTAGTCWMGCKGDQPVQLQAGDAILFPHGDAHLASGQPADRSGYPFYDHAP